MKHKIIFIVFFLVYLIVCFYHFRWEKYYDEYYAAAWDPYQFQTLEVSSQVDKAMEHFNLVPEGISGRFIAFNNGVVRDKRLALNGLQDQTKIRTGTKLSRGWKV